MSFVFDPMNRELIVLNALPVTLYEDYIINRSLHQMRDKSCGEPCPTLPDTTAPST